MDNSLIKKRHNETLNISQQTLDKIEDMAGKGLTNQQIAGYFAMTYKTFNNRKNEYPEIAEAILRGKSKALYKVSGHLFEQIEAGSTAATVFYLKTQGGWRETDHEEKKSNSVPVVNFNGIDSNEAAKIYQQIMSGAQEDERDSTGE